MTIGKLLKHRMKSLNISIDELANKSLVNKQTILAILQDKIEIKDIDECDLDFISQILYCTPDFFKNNEKYNDFFKLNNKDSKDNLVLAKLLCFCDDFWYLKNLKDKKESCL